MSIFFSFQIFSSCAYLSHLTNYYSLLRRLRTASIDSTLYTSSCILGSSSGAGLSGVLGYAGFNNER